MPINYEINLLILVNLWLDNICQIKIKILQYRNLKYFFGTKLNRHECAPQAQEAVHDYGGVNGRRYTSMMVRGYKGWFNKTRRRARCASLSLLCCCCLVGFLHSSGVVVDDGRPWTTELLVASTPMALFSSQKFSRFPVTSNLTAHAWSIKYTWKQKLFAQFICKPRDESFEPSYSIIGQCLSNKNESATVPFTSFCELNKAYLVQAHTHSHYFTFRTVQLLVETISSRSSIGTVGGRRIWMAFACIAARPCLVPKFFAKSTL